LTCINQCRNLHTEPNLLTMKNLIYALAILLFVSCGTQEAVEEAKTPAEERSIGFNTNLPDLKWHLGTEAAIQIVKDFDALWANNNYDAMLPMLADTAIFNFADGRKAASPTEFIEILKADENSDPWTFNYAFSVDLDPEIGGEHVQAGFTGMEIKENDTTKTRYHESYYIIQGKIIMWNQYTQKDKKE